MKIVRFQHGDSHKQERHVMLLWHWALAVLFPPAALTEKQEFNTHIGATMSLSSVSYPHGLREGRRLIVGCCVITSWDMLLAILHLVTGLKPHFRCFIFEHLFSNCIVQEHRIFILTMVYVQLPSREWTLAKKESCRDILYNPFHAHQSSVFC